MKTRIDYTDTAAAENIEFAIFELAGEIADALDPTAPAIDFEGYVYDALAEFEAEGKPAATRAQVLRRAMAAAKADS